jgi:hypothetical protein
MNGKMPNVADLAARAALSAPVQPQAMPAAEAVRQYLGLSVPTMQAMAPRDVQCFCGKCQGPAIEFGRIHFIAGQPPQAIHVKPDEPKPAA